MAVFTTVAEDEVARICAAHGLGSVRGLEPVPAGTVNSNYFVETEAGRRFLRVYEEQGPEGVAYEAALLRYMAGAGLAVPRRVEGPSATIAGKPVGIFEVVAGVESCQRGVTEVRAGAVGAWLAGAHVVLEGFSERRAGRFSLADVEARLEQVARAARADLADAVARLRDVLAEVRREWPSDAPSGVIHGDLFRDNVRWEGDRIVAVIDWESASDGLWVYDVMVAVLAWCFDDRMRWDLARALVRGYDAVRPLAPVERRALRIAGLAAAARFTTTRLTDIELRPAIGPRTHKDYRRFLARLEAVAALSAEEVEAKLL